MIDQVFPSATPARRLDSRLIAPLRVFHALLRPVPNRAAWQWADENRSLPSHSASPGPWDSSITPWIKTITEAIHSGKYRRIVSIQGSQTSKTDGVCICSMGHIAADKGVPQLFIGPTRNNVEYISRNRLGPMIASVPALYDGLLKGQKDRLTEKIVNGVPIAMGWAGSATELASRPVYIVYLDEVDSMAEIPGQGHPVFIAEARIATYRHAGGCSVITGTPTSGLVATEIDPVSKLRFWAHSDPAEVGSFIWRLYQEGTTHHWATPCPDCGEYFVAYLDGLYIPDDATPRQARQEARLVCPNCGSMLEDKVKGQMNARGVYIAPGQTIEGGAVIGSPPESSVWSGWISGLWSPWVPWGERAEKLVEARLTGSESMIQPVYNTDFGQPYSQSGGSVDWRMLNARKMPYKRGEVPAAAHVIIGAVDVQSDRLEMLVVGFGSAMESYVIDWKTIRGNTREADVWSRLDEYRYLDYGGKIIERLGIDYGYAESKSHVVAFCERHSRWAVPMLGKRELVEMARKKRLDVSTFGKNAKRGVSVWFWDNNRAKSDVYARFEWPADQPGGFFLPDNADDYLLKHLTAEIKIEGSSEWRKLRRNDYLDCLAMSWVLAWVIKVRKLRVHEAAAAQSPPPDMADSAGTAPKPPPPYFQPVESAPQLPRIARMPGFARR